MKFYDIHGNLKGRDVSKYLIDWNKESKSKVQFKTKQFLKQYWEKHICFEEFPVYGSRMTIDILNATKRIAVEVQGKQHRTFNKHFHKKSRVLFHDQIRRDSDKEKWLEANEFKFIEIYEEEVKDISVDLIYQISNIIL